MTSNLVVYLPVFHRGYEELFRRHSTIKRLCIVGQEVLTDIKYEEKEIRAISPEMAQRLVSSLGIFNEVVILTPRLVRELNTQRVIAASDEVTRALASYYWEAVDLQWDTAFLRYDPSQVFSQQPVKFDQTTNVPLHMAFILTAQHAAQQSSDWWRQVGAVVAKDGNILFTAHNRHDPSEHTPYAIGDPRDHVEAGQHSEICGATHAEGTIIAAAARAVLKGSDFYVTTFPCPACARLLAHAGVSRLYFKTGHASLDGETVLRSHGVQLIQVK